MSVVASVRRAVHDVLPNVPVANVTTLAEQVDASILPERLIAMLSELFGVTGGDARRDRSVWSAGLHRRPAPERRSVSAWRLAPPAAM